jgi:predicted flap endonuclease-1-like 5' DNA nuclease
VLDRAIAEAKAEAPPVSLILDTVAIVANTPVRVISKRIEHVAEAELVSSQFTEFRKTGKVRETLGDDDKAVRKLFAEEVLKVPLSTLDCQWPREAGTANGQGAEPRVTRKIKPAKAEAAAPRPKPVKTEKPKPAPKAAPVASVEPAASAPVISRIRLSREAAVVDAPSIGPKTANRLAIIGVKTVGDLLALAPEDAAARIKASHINAGVIKDWQAQALLACSVPELNGTNAQLLVGAGIYSVDDLAAADVDFLIDAIAMYAQSKEGERSLRGSALPDRSRVKTWIESALHICESRSAA